MSGAKFTPGPWVKTGRCGEGLDTNWGIKHKSPGSDGGEFCRVNVLNKTAEAIATGEANARLVSAAPDLLAACEYALDTLDQTAGGETVAARIGLVGGFHAAELLRVAVAKATGEGTPP